MNNYNFLTLPQLGVVNIDFDTPEIINFYQNQIYPELYTLYQKGLSSFNNRIVALQNDNLLYNEDYEGYIEDAKHRIVALENNMNNIKKTLNPNNVLMLL